MLRFCLRCVAPLLALSLAQPVAANDPRLASIKQHALALYTVSLAQRRQFLDHAMVVLAAADANLAPQQIKIWIDDELWAEYRYRPTERALLGTGAQHQLGIAPMPQGRHQIKLEVLTAAADPLVAEQQLSFDAWPLGLYIQLKPGPGAAPAIQLSTRVPGTALLAAADFELGMGQPGKAVTLLQNLAAVDPALARQPPYSERIGRGLRDWGLDVAAEASMAGLAANAQAPKAMRQSAGLQAAELALERGAIKQADDYLIAANEDSVARRILQARVHLARGEFAQAGRLLPASGAQLWRYQLAAALIVAGQRDAGQALLQELMQHQGESPLIAHVGDLAALKLGYLWLAEGRPQDAATAFARIQPDKSAYQSGLLGAGWAALAMVTEARPLPDPTDRIRTDFARGIDAALNGATAVDRPRRIAALRAALAPWLELADADPREVAVQEALVAIPYALAQLGARDKAIEFADKAVTRLNAMREHLLAEASIARRRSVFDAQDFVARAWPPHPSTWPFESSADGWWLADKPAVPAQSYLPRWLGDERVLRELQAISTLQEVEALAVAAGQVPSLALRSERLLADLAAERQRRQTSLDRYAVIWLRTELVQLNRYLVLARFVLANLYEQDEPR